MAQTITQTILVSETQMPFNICTIILHLKWIVYYSGNLKRPRRHAITHTQTSGGAALGDVLLYSGCLLLNTHIKHALCCHVKLPCAFTASFPCNLGKKHSARRVSPANAHRQIKHVVSAFLKTWGRGTGYELADRSTSMCVTIKVT